MFCNSCGHKNPDNSNFCSKCGQPLNCAEDQATPGNQMYTVTIFRESQTYVINPPININIDDSEHYSVENGGNLKVDLAEGKHNILFYQSLRKKNVTLDLQSDTSITLKWNRITGAIEAAVYSGKR